jgi:hypothetical protein
MRFEIISVARRLAVAIAVATVAASPTAALSATPPSQRSTPAGMSQADEATSFTGFIASLREGRLTASNVPITAPPGAGGNVMVLRRDGSATSLEEEGLEIVRNADGTISVKKEEGEGAADGATAAGAGESGAVFVTESPAGEAGSGEAAAGKATTAAKPDDADSTAAKAAAADEAAPMTWTAAGDGEDAVPASEEPLTFTEFVVDDDTETAGELLPGAPVRITFEVVDGAKVARKIEVG